MSRVLWFGDSADTGFGTVTNNIVPRLRAMGHDVRTLVQNATWWHHGGADSGILAMVPPGDLVNVLTIGFPDDGWLPDTVVLTADYGQALQQVAGNGQALFDAFSKRNVLHYCPIEGDDLSPEQGNFWQIIHPIAMSQFGADQIEKVTGKRPPVIPHGVDTSIFHPLPLQIPEIRNVVDGTIIQNGLTVKSKRQARFDFGLDPSHIVLLRCDRYMRRKRYPAMLRALTPTLLRGDVDLVIHCRVQDQAGALEYETAKMPPEARKHVGFTQKHNTWRGMSAVKLAELYNAADIYVSCGPEGFGLTISESLACGVPAVGINDSAVPEVIGTGGLLVKVAHYEDNEYNHRWANPDEDELRRTVELLIDDPELREELGHNGIEHVKRFNWDTAAAQFSELCRVA